MRINVSSKTVSVGISFLVFVAIGILAVAFIGRGTDEENISFDMFSKVVYSEHEGWTDISENSEQDYASESDSSEDLEALSVDEIVSVINSKYNCSGNITDLQFSDEMGISIEKISFLDGYTPENVSLKLGYVFAGENVFDLSGVDITESLSGYNFAFGRDGKGRVLFEKSGEYYYLLDGSFYKSDVANNIFDSPSYFSKFDESFPLFADEGYWGIKNSKGEILVKAQYTYGYGFSEGVCCFASKSKKLYFYNESGKLVSSGYVVPEQGFGAFKIQNGITLVSNGKKNLIMKSSGGILQTPKDYKVVGCSDGMILLEKNGTFGFMNQNGVWKVQPCLNAVSYFCEGLSVVSEKGSYVIDVNGEIVIQRGFDYISDFSDGHCILYSKDSGWYIAKKQFLG